MEYRILNDRPSVYPVYAHGLSLRAGGTAAMLEKLRAPRITVKDRVKAVVSIVWRGREGYVEYMDGVSRCPTGLSQERADSDIRRLNLDVEKEFAEAVHSQESEATLPEVWPLQTSTALAFHPAAYREWRPNPTFKHFADLSKKHYDALQHLGSRSAIWGWQFDAAMSKTPNRHLAGLTRTGFMACLLYIKEQPNWETMPSGKWPVLPSDAYWAMVESGQQRDPALQNKVDTEPWLLDRQLLKTAVFQSPQHIVELARSKGFPEHRLPLVYKQATMVEEDMHMYAAMCGVDRASVRSELVANRIIVAKPKRDRGLIGMLARAFGGAPEYYSALTAWKQWTARREAIRKAAEYVETNETVIE